MRRKNGSNKAKRILHWFSAILLLAFFIPVLQIGNAPVTSEGRKLQRLIRYLRESKDEMPGYGAEMLGRSRDPRALRALLAAMKDTDKNIRYFAVTGLGYTRDHRATKALLAVLSEGLDSNYDQRAVAQSLGRLHDPLALGPLLKLASNVFRENRLNAVRALGKFNDKRAFDALCVAMKDPDNDIRAAAAQAIAISGDSRSEDMLRPAANNNVFSRDRTSDYFALVPDGPGVAVLIAAFNNHDPKILMALERAFRSLAKIQTKPEALAKVLREALENGPLDLRIRAADGLGAFKDDRTISVLIKATKDPDPTVRAESMKSLGRIHNDRADAEIINHAKNEHSLLHKLAAQIVCSRRDLKHPILMNLLRDKDRSIRLYAVVMGDRGVPRSIPALMEAAQANNSDGLEITIINALSETLKKVDAANALEKLVSLYRSRDLGVQKYIVFRVIAGLKDSHAVEVMEREYEQHPEDRSEILKIAGETQNFLMSRILLAGLKDKDVSLQSSAAKYLSNSKDPAVIKLLIDSLDDPNPQLRTNAAKLLQQMQIVYSVPELIQSLYNPAKAQAAAITLGQIGDRRAVVPLLHVIQRLPSSCPPSCACGCIEQDIRAAAIRALGALGDRRAVGPLLEISGPILSSRKISYGHRKVLEAVVEALGNLRDRKAVPVLIAALKGLSPDISSASAIALGHIKDKHAIDALVEALDYEHRKVRESAAHALEEIGDIRASRALAAKLSTCDMQKAVAPALIKLKWQPQTNRDRLYFLLSQSRWDEIAANWKSNRKILLDDLKSGSQETMEGAVWPLIAIGDDAVVGDLVAALKAKGTDGMARIFFNCGQPQLAEASIRWALIEGMDILDLEMEQNLLGWGERNLDEISHLPES